jgi:hypothetical protein
MESSGNKVIAIINEEIKLFESDVSGHAYKRLNDRVKVMKDKHDITPAEAANIEHSLNQIGAYNFRPDKSYGIMLGRFNINPNSAIKTEKHPSGVYYTIDIIGEGDSTGNEIWAIIRNNKLITVFLRKTIQRLTADRPVKQKGLGVDHIIDNFDDFLRKIEIRKQEQKQKELERRKQEAKTINIKGVWWVIDATNERIYKKNKPDTFVSFDNLIEYPEWDDATKEEILKILATQDKPIPEKEKEN